MDDKRTFLAIALAIAVLLAWTPLAEHMGWIQPQQRPAATQEATPAPAPAAQTAVAPASSLPVFTPSAGTDVKVETPLYSAVIYSGGGILRSFTLKHYDETICLMVGGFLMAADYSGQCIRILYLGEAASVIVALIGLFQKLGYDPLGLLKGYVVGDWEYTHMLSTLGNNNWLSGYYSVMLPLSLSLFCKAAEEGRRAASILLGGGNVLVVMMLFLQGSDGGVMVACVTLWICFWSSRKKNGLWEPLLVLLSGVCIGMLLWGKVMQSLGTYDILLQDGIARKMAVWQGWFLLAVVCLLFCGIHYALPEKKKRALQIGALCGSLLLAAGVIIWYILKLQGSDFAEWGNRRGMLWQMAWQGFCRGDLKQKLLGAGPDCFAAYLEQVLPGGTVLFDKGYFAGSIFTNAHNEWLTTLINLGVLGTAAYAAVFLTALRKYRRNSMAIMLLFTYGMHSLISFQQVLNTPFFFLLLGVCEAEQRMNQQYNTDTHEESIEVG